MNIALSSKKAEISDHVKEYAAKKFEKLDRFFTNDANALIKFRQERGRYIVEATVENSKLYFRAEQTTSDPYASIDNAVDVIERQIRKNKTRLEKRLKEGAFEREIDVQPVIEDDYEVVRRKRFEVKPMTLEEAILQMNLLNHEFFVFKNVEENNRLSVVYKRKDKGYGLIEDEE